MEFLAKKNRDGSYSVSIPAKDLVSISFVDYYDEAKGTGFQRHESLLPRRAKDIEAYISRCVSENLQPRLFELTANARKVKYEFEPLDNDHFLGFLTIKAQNKWLSIVDGGTRLQGIKNALERGIIPPNMSFDARLFVNMTVAEEIAHFLLINDTQKKVRTDLAVRVAQRRLDDESLSDDEKTILSAVMGSDESWRFEASRIAARMNTEDDSPWKSLVQMPNEQSTKPIKMQAFCTSLDPFLKRNRDLHTRLEELEKSGKLAVGKKHVTKIDFLCKVLKNFWNAVGEANPDAREEPHTSVLWGSIGASACHIALGPILGTLLDQGRSPSTETFKTMMSNSVLQDYTYWFTRAGSKKNKEYPSDKNKGEATKMTGAANYARLGEILEREWRASLHSSVESILISA